MGRTLRDRSGSPTCPRYRQPPSTRSTDPVTYEDAEVASRALGIVLTKRGKHQGQDIPMCGVPIHRSDEYLHRLIALAHQSIRVHRVRGLEAPKAEEA